ncbi:MAG: HAD family hydrolase [Pseudomonadota bacterium]
MTRIQLITLDLDNTLWNVDSTIRRAEASLRAWLGEHAPAALQIYAETDMTEFRQRAVEHAPDKRHDLSYLRVFVLTEVCVAAGYSASEASTIAEDAFAVFFDGRNQVDFYPGAKEMLATLSQDYPLLALTNGNANIERVGIGQYFQGAISSADVGASKPDAEMFNAALKNSDCNAADAIHVGDNLIDDIQGAKAVGMHTIWVNLAAQERRHDEPMADIEIRHLNDMSAAVAELNNR